MGCIKMSKFLSVWYRYPCLAFHQAPGSLVSCVQCVLAWEVVPLSSVEPKRFAQLWIMCFGIFSVLLPLIFPLSSSHPSLLLFLFLIPGYPTLFLLLLCLSLFFFPTFLPSSLPSFLPSLPSPHLCRSRILSSMARQKGLSRLSCMNHEEETLSLDVTWTFMTTVPRGWSMAKAHRWRMYVIGLFPWVSFPVC